MRLSNQNSGAERAASGGEGLANEQQLWDLMRPESTAARRQQRAQELSQLLKSLLSDYPQLLVMPLVAAATWVFLSLQ